MFKKIAAAMAICAASTFATWDYYALPEANKGTVKASFQYDTDDPWSMWQINLGARYIVIPNLEVSLTGVGYGSQETDGWDGSGFMDITLGARYQMMPVVSLFLDLHIPTGDEDEGMGNDEFGFTLGGQYSQELIPNLLLGTEAGLYWGFEHSNWNPGFLIHIAGEIGYSIADIGLTPFVGLEFKYRLTESERHDHGVGDDGDKNINIWLGASYAINAQMAVEGKLIIRSGDIDGDATGIAATFYYNF